MTTRDIVLDIVGIYYPKSSETLSISAGEHFTTIIVCTSNVDLVAKELRCFCNRHNHAFQIQVNKSSVSISIPNIKI